MSSIKFWTRILCVTAVYCSLLACGKANEKAPALASSGKHPDTWLAGHRAAYQQNRDQCRECHGIDLKGGITKVDCFNQASLGQCHAGGHPPRNVPHALPFKAGAVHGFAAKNDLGYCQSCHGTVGGPGSNPRFNVPLGALINGCEDCHKPFSAHPPLLGTTSGWNGHSSAGSMGNNCTLCHGVDLTGAGGVGPGCNSCHIALNAVTIPTVGTCTSCHAKPPETGNHAVHNALAGVCGTCHDGAGNGTAKHNNGTKDVAFASAYNAKSGAATKNPDGSCTNISCHGGITTPAWGGALTSGCRSCHSSGTSQYNSYNSGLHSLHIAGIGMQCEDCHTMSRTSGANSHYSGLGTANVFELPASVTIRVPGYPSCNPGSNPAPGTYSITTGCHGTETWN